MNETTLHPEQETEQTKVRVRYDKMDTTFASQFIVNASREEVIVNFSPGYIADPQTNERLLPVQTRIAMTPAGTARLVNTLTAVLRNMQEARQAASAEPEEVPPEKH